MIGRLGLFCSTRKVEICRFPSWAADFYLTEMLSEKAIEEYRQIYKKEFGTELALEEARESAASFMRLFQLVYKPITKSESVKLDAKQEGNR